MRRIVNLRMKSNAKFWKEKTLKECSCYAATSRLHASMTLSTGRLKLLPIGTLTL